MNTYSSVSFFKKIMFVMLGSIALVSFLLPITTDAQAQTPVGPCTVESDNFAFKPHPDRDTFSEKLTDKDGSVYMTTWFAESARPIAIASIKTSPGCYGQSAQVTLYSSRENPPIEIITTKEIVIPETGKAYFPFFVGQEYCEELSEVLGSEREHAYDSYKSFVFNAAEDDLSDEFKAFISARMSNNTYDHVYQPEEDIFEYLKNVYPDGSNLGGYGKRDITHGILFWKGTWGKAPSIIRYFEDLQNTLKQYLDSYSSQVSYITPCEVYAKVSIGSSFEQDFDSPRHTLRYHCRFNDDGIDGVEDCDNSIPWSARTPEANISGLSIDASNPCYEKGAEGNRLADCQELLAPLPGFGDRVDADLKIGEYINTLLQMVIGFMGIIAVLMIIASGVKYMTTENFGGKADAKATIANAFLGLLIAVSIFIILKTINPDLLNLDVGIDPLTIGGPAELNSDGSYTVVNTSGKKTKWKVGGEIIKQGELWADVVERHDLRDLRPIAEQLGFEINRPDCVRVGDSGCTTMQFEVSVFNKLRSNLQKLKQECPGCAEVSQNTDTSRDWIITGGSESWLHSTHGPDRAVLDMVPVNPNINQYIAGQNTFPGGCVNISPQQGASYIDYVKSEDSSCSWKPAPHWHAVFK